MFLFFFFFSILCASEVSWNGKLYDDKAVAELITVITSTNPIPSIPSTKYIREAQESLLRIPALARCKKIIVFDGIPPGFESRKDDYEEYKRRVEQEFPNTELVFCKEWLHLAGALDEAVKHVTTPYIFMHQHDIVLIKDFDLNGLIATMEANDGIQHVLLSTGTNNYGTSADAYVEGTTFVPLSRHFTWSDMTHVTRASYYREFVLPLCRHRRGFMEWTLNGALEQARKEIGTAGHLPFGTYLYGNLQDGYYTRHTDGRGSP